MAKSHSVAQAKYDRTHCKYYTLKMNLANDADIICKLSEQKSMQGYIKQLIREDIARTRTRSETIQSMAETIPDLPKEYIKSSK